MPPTPASAERPFHVVLFGATGYTGGLVATALAQRAGGLGLRWALAGRDLQKPENAVAPSPPTTRRWPTCP